MKDYGFSVINYENIDGYNYEAQTIAFGDGKTRINSLIWDDQVGIAIYRDEALDPFLHLEFSETSPAPEMPDEKVFITFDNAKSIDAMIKQLTYIREHLTRKTEVVNSAEAKNLGVVFNYDPELEKPELPISKFKICQLKMCGSIAAELSRQCPGITTEQSQMGTIIKAADLVCDAVNNQGGTDGNA